MFVFILVQCLINCFSNYIKLKAIFLEPTVWSEFAHRSFRVRLSFTHRSFGILELLCQSVTFPDLQLTEMRV